MRKRVLFFSTAVLLAPALCDARLTLVAADSAVGDGGGGRESGGENKGDDEREEREQIRASEVSPLLADPQC